MITLIFDLVLISLGVWLYIRINKVHQLPASWQKYVVLIIGYGFSVWLVFSAFVAFCVQLYGMS